MKNADLQNIVNDFVRAVPDVIASARRFNGGACIMCKAPRGKQHGDACALWGLIDARISYRVAAEGPKTTDTNRNAVMRHLEVGGTAFGPDSPELTFAPSAAACDEWWPA